MTKTRSTKSALISSVVALLLCFTMLLGTTFAWFTDSVTSSGNIIQSGTLEVEMWYAKGTENPASAEWMNADGVAIYTANQLWEPGYTDAKHIKISNVGSLALKYQLAIVPTGEVSELADVIDVYLYQTEGNLDNATQITERTAIDTTMHVGTLADVISKGIVQGNLAADTDYTTTIVLKMHENAGNEYQGLEIGDDFTIQLLATQYTEESDSFDADYDADAWAPGMLVYNEADLKAALANGGSVTLAADVEVTETIIVPEIDNTTYSLRSTPATVLNLNGYEISYKQASGSVIRNEGNLVITGGGKITSEASSYAIRVQKGSLTIDSATLEVTGVFGAISMFNDAQVTINGGTYTAIGAAGKTHHCIYVGSGADLVINGGTFEHKGAGVSDSGATLTVYAGSEGGATINGGTFIGSGTYINPIDKYDSACYLVINGGCFSKNPSAYVTDGYQVVDNGDGTYTVLPNGLVTVSGYAHLYTDGTDYYVYDAEGLISMRNFWADNWGGNNMWGRSYNIMADINATGYTWNNVFVVVGSNDNDGFVIDGHGNTITGLTVNGSMFTGTPNGGNAGTKPGEVKALTFDNVTVNGDHWTAVVWGNTYGEIVFDDVHVINSTISGKCNTAAFVGGTAQESGDVTVTFNNCSVENTAISANGAFSGVEGDWASDPNGANVFLSRAFSKAYIVFEGENISNNNTVTNTNGVVGGGIYGYTTLFDGWWAGTNTCDSFTDWNGLVVTSTPTDLAEALAAGNSVILPEDVIMESATTAPYGNKYGVALDGGVLDGNGNELYMECYGDDYGVMTTGGTVKNITIKEGCRAIMIMYPTTDIIIDNVNIGGDGVLYPINTGEAGSEGIKLIVTNSTLAGWTSYSNIESASFTNVKFEQGTYYDNIYGRVLKPYVTTTLTNCSFIEHMNLDLSALIEGHKITITNCTVNGQELTADVITVSPTDEQYDTELFTVDLPSWATSINDCIVFN